jgi:phosphate transport system substrate-binding protein
MGRKMKKIITLFIAVTAFGLAFSHPAMGEPISIVGTGDGVIVLGAIAKAFNQENPGVTVVVPKSIGSGAGIKSVGKDKNVIGRVARGIKDTEKHYGLRSVPYAKVPTIFLVNRGVGITGLTTEQVCGIYSGKVTNWKEVGGKDARIRVVRREKGDSSLRVLLKSFPGFRDISITSKSKTAYSTPENISVVENKAGTIGFGPYDVARNAGVDILTINGKKATDPGYPSSGTLSLIFKERNYRGNIKKFVEFAAASVAHDAIKQAGGIPFLN